jgi:hypothetical protein
MRDMLRPIRLPQLRVLRITLLNVFAVAGVVMGLLAMHAVGVADASPPGGNVVSAQTAEATAAAPDGGALDAPSASGPTCDSDCTQGVLDCVMMVMGCAMLLTVAALVWFAHRPSIFRGLLEAGSRLMVTVRSAVPLHALRPDLVLLSVSRT